MWPIQEVGVEVVQLVRMNNSGYASVRERLGLCHTIWCVLDDMSVEGDRC
jgi:hypothetical protein